MNGTENAKRFASNVVNRPASSLRGAFSDCTNLFKQYGSKRVSNGVSSIKTCSALFIVLNFRVYYFFVEAVLAFFALFQSAGRSKTSVFDVPLPSVSLNCSDNED